MAAMKLYTPELAYLIYFVIMGPAPWRGLRANANRIKPLEHF